MHAFYQRHHKLFEIAFWPVYLYASNWVGAVSVLREYARDGRVLASWEPYVWEFSSGTAWLVLIYPILRLAAWLRFRISRWPMRLASHVAISAIVSLLHVITMVGLRELVYQFAGREYDFGNWGAELIYEYRKDVLSYFTILIIAYVYPLLRDRWLKGGDSLAPIQTFTSRKGGREYPVGLADIQWVRAASNYVNVHTPDGVFPVRITLRSLEEQLPQDQFSRVHRSVIVRLGAVRALETLDSGDGRARMTDGTELPVSRRYRKALREQLGLQQR